MVDCAGCGKTIGPDHPAVAGCERSDVSLTFGPGCYTPKIVLDLPKLVD